MNEKTRLSVVSVYLISVLLIIFLEKFTIILGDFYRNSLKATQQVAKIAIFFTRINNLPFKFWSFGNKC
ncbi:hypothetical protein AAX05_01580 [Moraxella bovoculi]|uniref:Uncharacterized protein n=1 Tax=Moraxella bovoculi TaxID=386891 RepID=A0AAC8T8N6_9GAMM|nr:hypothetical protein AAX06_09650 [Moraxella bovoculi]AKG09085.1 hypothetical protein AAX05_01580 [Moraxella bovoculi]AKG12912.1 hypothetical protein AAX11_01335 [Moraxella bovoculi]